MQGWLCVACGALYVQAWAEALRETKPALGFDRAASLGRWLLAQGLRTVSQLRLADDPAVWDGAALFGVAELDAVRSLQVGPEVVQKKPWRVRVSVCRARSANYTSLCAGVGQPNAYACKKDPRTVQYEPLVVPRLPCVR